MLNWYRSRNTLQRTRRSMRHQHPMPSLSNDCTNMASSKHHYLIIGQELPLEPADAR